MVLKRLGPSLQALLEDLPSRKYSLKTTLMIAPELVERIRFIHSKGYVHRDIKPANFMVGLGEDQVGRTFIFPFLFYLERCPFIL